MTTKKPYGELNSSFSLLRREVITPVGDVSMTRQEFASECDINGIMARYEKVGGHLGGPNREPMYLDLSAAPADLMDALETVRAAEYAFMQLPASVRKEFENDAMRFVEFASDGNNIEQMRTWGLAEPAPLEEPIRKVEIVNPPPKEPAKPA